jgi:hypothetical protein
MINDVDNCDFVKSLIEKNNVNKVSTLDGFSILFSKYSKLYWRNQSGFLLRL